jgi:hypothetical protein
MPVIGMVVMADMVCCGARLVHAVVGHRRPGELERQQDQQQDREPTAHGGGV